MNKIDPDEIEALCEGLKKGIPNRETLSNATRLASQWLELETLLRHGISIGKLKALLLQDKHEPEPRPDEKKDDDGAAQESPEQKPQSAKNKPKNHGRLGTDAYTGAQHRGIGHDQLVAGSPCPCCQKKLQKYKERLFARLKGNPPVSALIYHVNRLFCAKCDTVFEPPLPEDARKPKYDASVKALLGMFRYGYGVPFFRLEKIQGCFGVPLPDSTQFSLSEELANEAYPVYCALRKRAAQAPLVYIDDTYVRILSQILENKGLPKKAQRASHTTGIVAKIDGRTIVLYLSGRNHAGENLSELMANRLEHLPPFIQMSDALALNTSSKLPPLQRIIVYCLFHARKRFVKAMGAFESEWQKVLKVFATIYRHEAEALKQGLDPQQCLAWHQRYSRTDERASRLSQRPAHTPLRGRAQRPGPGHCLHAQVLEQTHPFPERSRRAFGQQCLRTGASGCCHYSQEFLVLPNPKRCLDRLGALQSHQDRCREWGQPHGLPGRSPREQPRRARAPAVMVSLELPAAPGASQSRCLKSGDLQTPQILITIGTLGVAVP